MLSLNLPTAVIVKGNPKRMLGKKRLAERYYGEIENYLISKGFKVVFSESEPFTCPPKGDIYIAHSRGVGRARCFDDKTVSNFYAKLGDINGALNPDDRRWLQDLDKQYATIAEIPPEIQPPEDHFIFSAIHRKEVDRVIGNFRKKYPRRVVSEETNGFLFLKRDLSDKLYFAVTKEERMKEALRYPSHVKYTHKAVHKNLSELRKFIEDNFPSKDWYYVELSRAEFIVDDEDGETVSARLPFRISLKNKRVYPLFDNI